VAFQEVVFWTSSDTDCILTFSLGLDIMRQFCHLNSTIWYDTIWYICMFVTNASIGCSSVFCSLFVFYFHCWNYLIFPRVYCRCKYHRLKYGTELEQGDMIPPKFEKELRGMFHLIVYCPLAFLSCKVIRYWAFVITQGAIYCCLLIVKVWATDGGRLSKSGWYDMMMDDKGILQLCNQ